MSDRAKVKKPWKIPTYKKVAQCNICANLGQDHVPPAGNPFADLMIIGQSPGAKEVQAREPFVGPSGEMVTFMLDEAELDRDEVYITNALKCRPPGNRPGLPGELANCWRTWLFNEIKHVNPKLILILGKDAHDSVIGRKGEWGHLVENRSKKRLFLSSYHPSYFLRKGDFEGFINVGAKVKELLSSVEEL